MSIEVRNLVKRFGKTVVREPGETGIFKKAKAYTHPRPPGRIFSMGSGLLCSLGASVTKGP